MGCGRRLPVGEIFERTMPDNPLRFTGERMTSDAVGQIEYEHIHRYLFARQLVRDRAVVDVASGEGYGGALLAQTARRVIGVEIAEEAVRHAALSYRRSNLSFIRGDARDLPLENLSVDVAVSFETIEHLVEQEKFVRELRRVVRPDGFVVISSPDRDIYSPIDGQVNPFHCKELTQKEFVALLKEHFAYCYLYMQRPLTGCAIIEDAGSQSGSFRMTFERRGANHFEASCGLARAPYLIAVASDQPFSLGFDSLYIHTSDVDHGLREARNASAAQTAAHTEVARQAQLLERLTARVADQSEELTALREQNQQLRAKLFLSSRDNSRFLVEKETSTATQPKPNERRPMRANEDSEVAEEPTSTVRRHATVAESA
jgi:SAM-dependent methyltransferase